jgi:hypothetical protein
MRKMHSFTDSRGMMFVDCSECVRGGNGDHSCSAGARYRRPKKGGCFIGQIRPELLKGDENA